MKVEQQCTTSAVPPLRPHRLMINDQPLFQGLYVAKCLSCKHQVFRLECVEFLLIWNQRKYLVINASQQRPQSLEFGKQNRCLDGGPLALNWFCEVGCGNCLKILGQHIVAPHFSCKILKKRILVQIDKISVYLLKEETFCKVRLCQAFQTDFQLVNQNGDVQRGEEKSQKKGGPLDHVRNLKRDVDLSFGQVEDPTEKLKEELREGILVYKTAFEKLQLRIKEVEKVCLRYQKIIEALLPRIGVQVEGWGQKGPQSEPV